ncbi:MAG: hypothetical protein ACJ71S_11560 [Acidobacteriaceae bacterium]
MQSLLVFLTLLDDWLCDVVFARTKEFAQLRAHDEQSACRHGTGYLEEQKSGARIGIGIGGPLEGDSQSGYLCDGK